MYSAYSARDQGRWLGLAKNHCNMLQCLKSIKLLSCFFFQWKDNFFYVKEDSLNKCFQSKLKLKHNLKDLYDMCSLSYCFSLNICFYVKEDSLYKCFQSKLKLKHYLEDLYDMCSLSYCFSLNICFMQNRQIMGPTTQGQRELAQVNFVL